MLAKRCRIVAAVWSAGGVPTTSLVEDLSISTNPVYPADSTPRHHGREVDHAIQPRWPAAEQGVSAGSGESTPVAQLDR